MADEATTTRENKIREIFQDVAANTEEPSTTYQANLNDIYRAPRQEVIDTIASQLNKTVVLKLREQIFEMFLEAFDE